MTFRALIIDDEAPARAKILRLLEHDERFETVGEAENGLVALQKFDELAPDLVFLDIQMPGIDGFEVLRALGDERDFVVVFSTAHDAHALEAFDAHALDYLLKPYDGARFQPALSKAWLQLSARRRTPMRLPTGQRLVVRTDDGWVAVPQHSVTHISADDKHAMVFTDQAQLRVRHGLSSLEKKLDRELFLRVHRGEIARVGAVVHYEPGAHGDGVLTLEGGFAVALSRTRRVAFLQRYRGT